MARIAREQQRTTSSASSSTSCSRSRRNDEGVQELAASRDEVLAHASQVEDAPRGLRSRRRVHRRGRQRGHRRDRAGRRAERRSRCSFARAARRPPWTARSMTASTARPRSRPPAKSSCRSCRVEQDPRVLALISEAQSYRRVRLYNRAVRALDPRARDRRSLDRRTRRAARRVPRGGRAGRRGRRDAQHRVAAARRARRRRRRATLQDVLALDPANERAAAMLRELGYEPVEEQAQQVPPARSRTRSTSLRRRGGARRATIRRRRSRRTISTSRRRAQQAAPPDDALPSFPLDDVQAAPAPIESAASFDLLGGKDHRRQRDAARERHVDVRQAVERRDRRGARGSGLLRVARPVRRREDGAQRAARARAEPPAPPRAPPRDRRAGDRRAARLRHARASAVGGAFALAGRVRHRVVARRPRFARSCARSAADDERDRPGRRRRGLREVQGEGLAADRRRRRHRALRSRPAPTRRWASSTTRSASSRSPRAIRSASVGSAR